MLPTQKPRRGLDDAQLAAIVLGSLEHFPQYRDVFHAVSVRAVAQDPRYVTLARLTEAPTDDEAAAVAADAPRARRPRWARRGAAALVARSLVAQPANARAVLAAGAAALGAHESILQRSAAHAAEHAGRGRRRAGRGLPAGAARRGRGARRGRRGPTGGDGPPCVYLRLPAEAGPRAWRAGLYARVDEGVYRRVSQEPPEAFQDSYLFRCVVEGRGALWLVGSRPARTRRASSGSDAAAAPEPSARPGTSRATARPARGAGVQVAALARRRRRPRSRRRSSTTRASSFCARLPPCLVYDFFYCWFQMVLLRAAWEGGIVARG